MKNCLSYSIYNSIINIIMYNYLPYPINMVFILPQMIIMITLVHSIIATHMFI